MKTSFKLLLTTMLMTGILQSCKKEALNEPKLQPERNAMFSAYKSVATELGFNVEDRQLPFIDRRYGNAAKWKEAITKYRKAHGSRLDPNHSNYTQLQSQENTGSGSAPTHKVTLIFEDGFSRTLTVPEDVTILDAAEEQGINLYCSDRAGASSTCVSKLKSGLIDQSNQSFLDDDDIAGGWLLPCVTYALTDVTIEVEKEGDFMNWKYNIDRYNFDKTVRESLPVQLFQSDEFGPESYNNFYGEPMFTKSRTSNWVFLKGPGLGFTNECNFCYTFTANVVGMVGLVDRNSNVWTWLDLTVRNFSKEGATLPGISVDCFLNYSEPSFTPENALRYKNIYMANIKFNYTHTTSTTIGPLSYSKNYEWVTPFMMANKEYR